MRIFLISIFLIINQCIDAFSQNLVVENRIWSEALFASEGNTVQTTHLFFSGDTIINGLICKFIYSSYSVNPSDYVPWDDRFIREDSNKVILHYAIGREEVLYDFNLKEGDVFYDNDMIKEYFVDSIRTLNVQGEMLKHFYLSTVGHSKLVWVEKYGSYSGVLTPFGLSGGIIKLLCVHDQDKLAYQNKIYNTCQLNGTYTGYNEVIFKDFSVYSIKNDQIQIQNKNQITGVISFFDTNGKVVLKEPISEPTTQFCMPYSGLFIYRVQSENGQTQTGKIMVTD